MVLLDRSDTIEAKIQEAEKAINKAKAIDEPRHRKDSLIAIAGKLPEGPEFQHLYIRAMSAAINAANEIADSQHRIHALLSITDELPKTSEFDPLRLKALRFALNMAKASDPHSRRSLLAEIAKGLPRHCDIPFYKQYTLLGIARDLPKTGEFLELYKESMQVAVAAANTIEEPFYRKYALDNIARELPKTDEFSPLYLQAITDSFNAVSSAPDPFIRLYALIDIFRDIPKSAEFFPLIYKVLKQTLDLFSIKMQVKGVKLIDVIDRILMAEEKGLKESRKAKYTREKYAHALAKELEIFGQQLNDIRFIEILKPYTHPWVRPKKLRAAIKKIVARLEELRNIYHGREIEKPLFVKQTFQRGRETFDAQADITPVKECLSIDLGATNTVIMKKKSDSIPEFVSLGSVSGQCGDACVIPTILSLKTDAIGKAVAPADARVSNFKKMLLEGTPDGKAYMERFLTILYQHLKREIGQRGGLLSIFANNLTDKLYVAVPVGFPEYKRCMKELVERIMKGVKAEFLEEPLAAAIGYQVAEKEDRVVMIIDFGGSTLDVMMLRLNINEAHVIAKPDRSKILGGHDIDLWLAEYLSGKLNGAVDSAFPELINRAEELKIALSDRDRVSFNWNGNEICKISRDDLEEILAEHNFYNSVDRAVLYVLGKAEKIGVSKEKIEAVLLTGGSSLIPSFREKIEAIFPALREQNSIYSHSPFSAVAIGATLYGNRRVIDRHLSLAYAIRYTIKDDEKRYAYDIVLEKGEPFPFEKTFKAMPAKKLGGQNEIYLELFEAPDSHIMRKWERNEAGMEFIRQTIKHTDNISFKGLRIINLTFDEPVEKEIYITFSVNDSGHLNVKYGEDNKEIETNIRLQ